MIPLLLLSLTAQRGTIRPAAAKSVAEIGVSERVLEPTHALAWFFIGARSSFLGALLAYLVGSTYRVMAARARAPQGALDPKVSSYANLVRAVTRRLASFCGSDNLLTLEAAIMATVPTRAISSPSQAWFSCVQNDTSTCCDLLFDELEQRIYTIDLCSCDRRQITALLRALRTEVSLLQEAV
ncbi:ash family protein [Aeromonas hydrophila]|uniref:ash family protein n=1 Tax=Aeromonas hydrophila TaxID=644 RepID=UPI0009B82F96|nr:ash family protein [Aeromonas hydrophila]WDA23095.1 ash family protein [Aeromonas hydrophila]WES93158.1 ash family protein [Aeromonas hydrophila]